MITPTGVTKQVYTNALTSGNATHVRITFPIQNKVFTDNNIEESGIHVLTILNQETDLFMGEAVATEVEISFLNGSYFDDFDWTEEFQLEFGVDISGTTKWVTIGYFHGVKPDKAIYTDVIHFVAYDRMTNFDIIADTFIDSLTFPVTIGGIYQKVCEYVGYGSAYIASGDENSTIMNTYVTKNPFDYGITCRQIIKYIAEVNCTYAYFNYEGKIKLRWFSSSADVNIPDNRQFAVNISDIASKEAYRWGDLEAYTWGQLEQFTWGELSGKRPSFYVKAVEVSSTETDLSYFYPNNYSENSKNLYCVVDNPLAIRNGVIDTTIAKHIYDRVTTIYYYNPMAVETIGNWLLEPGDTITVEYNNGNELFYLPMFSRSLNWNGSATDIYECTGNVERSKLTSTHKAFYEEGGKVKKIDIKLDGKYSIISGISIEEEGIEVSGAKYVKIRSGGNLDVDSENFKLDSENKKIDINTENFAISSTDKKMIAGNWTFDEYGMYGVLSNSNEFSIGSKAITENKYGTQIISDGSNGLIFKIRYQSSILPTIPLSDGLFKFKYDLSVNNIWRSMGGLANNLYLIGASYIGGPHDSELLDGTFCKDGYFQNLYPYPGFSYYSGHVIQEFVYGDIGSIDHMWDNAYVNKITYNTLVQSSSRDIKHDIRPMESHGEKIDKLNPVTFVYDKDPNEQKRNGLVYEDTVDVMPGICTNNESNKAINYVELIPILLKEIQELRARVKMLEEREEK